MSNPDWLWVHGITGHGYDDDGSECQCSLCDAVAAEVRARRLAQDRVAELEAALKTAKERQRERCSRELLVTVRWIEHESVRLEAAAAVRATPLVTEEMP